MVRDPRLLDRLLLEELLAILVLVPTVTQVELRPLVLPLPMLLASLRVAVVA